MASAATRQPAATAQDSKVNVNVLRPVTEAITASPSTMMKNVP
jgi:hypothetical protein